MKFDIARAWKDEAYRQTLSSEELNALPTNPAGELSEAELAGVCGGDRPDNYGLAAAAAATEHHHHTFAGICDINVFSLDVPVLALPRLINIGKCEKQICANI